jgi:putative alpha-1,2-mannosidase
VLCFIIVFFFPLFDRPLFDNIKISLPNAGALTIDAPGASNKHYVASFQINRASQREPFVSHQQVLSGSHLFFEMNDEPQAWGSSTLTKSSSNGDGGHASKDEL